jgi:hypothetical protein
MGFQSTWQPVIPFLPRMAAQKQLLSVAARGRQKQRVRIQPHAMNSHHAGLVHDSEMQGMSAGSVNKASWKNIKLSSVENKIDNFNKLWCDAPRYAVMA